ncbi:MAG: hypothetical protein ACTHLP_09760 [Rhizobiaceae bacterium]|jgi:hypothetical protein
MDKAREALEQLLEDPIIRLVMASDGVEADEIRNLFGSQLDAVGEGEGEIPAPYVIAASCCGGGMCCA